MMAAEHKKSRKTRKSALTREINTIQKFIAEEDRDEVSSRIKLLIGKFSDFEKAHDEYHDILEDESEMDESEAYFEEVQSKYIQILTSAKKWLSDTEAKPDVKPELKHSTSDKELNHTDFISLINLPKVEIEPFDGNPMNYHSFMALFREHVDNTQLTPSIKLSRLIQYTTGTAKKAILPCVMQGETGYDEALAILKKRFGSTLQITECVTRSIKTGKPIKSPQDLQKFSDDLNSCQATLSSMGRLQEIDTQTSIVDILGRLQPYIRNRWKREAMEHKRSHDSYPSFSRFVEFISEQAEDATDPVYGSIGSSSSTNSVDFKSRQTSYVSDFKPKHTSSHNASSFFNTSAKTDSKTLPCILCSENHRLFYCKSFKEMKPHERLQLVKDNKLCENCLLGNHVTSQCRKPSVCSVPGCGMKHTKFIHVRPGIVNNVSHASSQNVNVSQTETVHANNKSQVNVVVPTVKVNVNGKCDSLALLDNASNTTFCTERLVNKLGIKGSVINYKLNTLNSVNESKQSMVVELRLRSDDSENLLHLSNVHVVKQIPVNIPQVDLSMYPHLDQLPIANDDYVKGVDILIGQDHAEALVPLDVKRGDKGEPFAVRTLFGWSINGPVEISGSVSKRVVSHFISSSVDDDLKRLYDIETDVHSDKVSWSKEDKQVMELWDNNIKFVDGHYELPVPWKPDVSFPNNYAVAASRLHSLRKQLEKRNLTDQYDAEMKKLLDKGYAETVPESELFNSEILWYLPHQAVVTDKKPGKLRIVFDCASKFKGESLNDKAYQGPDINKKLLHVLLRFRENSIAVMADIESMYNQVRIPLNDRNALRFLWKDDSGQFVQYRMTSHLFGGVWCASSSTYALRRVLVDKQVDDLVSRTILDSFYVDDCLDSVMSKADAMKVVFGTKNVLATTGFNLTKFIVNDTEVMDHIPEDDRAKEVKDFSPQSKALGVSWDVTRDELYFKVDVNITDNITKRSMLSVIASTYDPLGLVSPIIMAGRMILQDVVRTKCSWDDPVSPRIGAQWLQWTKSLEHLGSIRFPRCVKPAPFDDGIFELHHFSDASSTAYGSCSYIRCVNKDGQIHVSLIMSKCKIAPIKQMTIPRLELQAAVLSARSDTLLRSELRIGILKSYFWTDSEIVLGYLKNDSSRFHVFVGNCVSEISSLTDVPQWHHIAGLDNPADLITRVQNPEIMDMDKWLHGPDFLREFKSVWQQSDVDFGLSPDDPEVKQVIRSTYLVEVKDHPVDVMSTHYSSWYRLKRAVALWCRLIQVLKTKDKALCGTMLTVPEIQEAELVIIKHTQWQFYSSEIERLTSGATLLKSSPVRDLLPMLNKDGIMCVGGRLKHADFPSDRKHPVIISHKHIIAVLIIRDFHSVAHLGTEWTISHLRSKYWITRARVLVKQLKKDCVTCKKLYASPCIQQMADLPPERLIAGEPPFTCIGCDCFGPFLVKVLRSEVKRYGLICTCFSVRAIHLEVLDSMSTDSFLNGLRRFVARRGTPEKVFCDNGTNFVGAQSEIDRCKSQLDLRRIQAYGTQANIEWKFNPPHASHMGGVWERMIQTVKRILPAMLENCRLTDEVLRTVFTEVESMVNSRPITKLSEDVNDMSPLTPNHLLLFRGGPAPVPGNFSQNDMYRNRWRYVQHLSNQFWSRWLREYLPELQKRTKWHNKERNIQVGDLVLVVGENTPRRLWPLGLVVQVRYGRDNLVRNVHVKTQSTTLVRPITKIVLLEAH